MVPRYIPRSQRRFFGIALLAILFAAPGCGNATSPSLVARGGRLDLRHDDLRQTIELRGEWLAKAGVDNPDFARFGFDDSDWVPVEVPNYFVDEGFPSEGLVWYRLHLRLPQVSFPLKGYVQNVDNAHAIYLSRPGADPMPLASSGRPGATAETTVRSRMPVSFDLPRDTVLVLSWKVANFDYHTGGPFYPIVIGSRDAIDRMLLWKLSIVFTMVGLYVLIGLAFLLYWVLHIGDLPTLAVGLLSLVMAVRTASTSGALELLLPHQIDFSLRILLEAISFVALPGLVALMLWAFFPRDMVPVRLGRWILRPSLESPLLGDETEVAENVENRAPREWGLYNTGVLAASIVTSLVFTTIVVVGTAEISSYVMAAARWIFLVLALGAFAIVVQAVLRKRPYSVSVGLGFLLLISAGLHDILLSGGIIFGNPYLTPYGFLGFVLVESYVLAKRYGRYAQIAHRDSRMLREEVAVRTRELRAATIAAHAANLAKGHFLSAVSHELRSPLGSILGYTRILHDELGDEMQPQHREFFETIRVSGERLIVLVNDILDVSRIEAGHLDLNLAPVDLHEIAQEVLDQVGPLLQDSRVTIRTDFVETERPWVDADPMRLRQVILNLAFNAVKFTDEGEIVLRTYATILQGDRAYAISVSDTGPGIAPELLPHLFDRFSHERHLYPQSRNQTGLGLTISRELVTRMKGRIQAESVLGGGSTFTVTIPAAAHVAGAAQDTEAGTAGEFS